MKIQSVLEVIDYKIFDGSKFIWKCFGENCFILDWWEGNLSKSYGSYKAEATIYFDTETKQVYLIELYDNELQKFHFCIDPNFADSYEQHRIRNDLPESCCPEDYQQISYANFDELLLEIVKIR